MCHPGGNRFCDLIMCQGSLFCWGGGYLPKGSSDLLWRAEPQKVELKKIECKNQFKLFPMCLERNKLNTPRFVCFPSSPGAGIVSVQSRVF